MKSETKQINKIINSIALILAVVMTAAAVLLGCKVAIMGVLPIHYIIGFAIVIVLIDWVIWVTMSKKAITVIMMLLTVCISAVMIVGYIAVAKVDSTLQKVSSEKYDIVQVSIIVREESAMNSFASLNGARIGYLTGYDYAWTVLDSVSQEAILGEVTEYSSIVELGLSLMNQSTDAIVIDTAYIEILNDFEGLENFSLSVRSIYTADIEVERTSDTGLVASGWGSEPAYDTNVTTIGDSSTVDIESKDYTDDTLVIYISGIDTWGNVNVRSRSDVNILAVINTKTGKLLMVNTPRDAYVPLVTKNGSMDKLTHAGLYGIECSETALENLYGIEIDYYVRLNFSGFEEIVDALGGIDVYSSQNFRVDDTFFVEGMNHLEGEDALRFARERYSFAGMGDVQRGKNQMEVIKAVIGKMTSFSMITNYTDVLDAVGDCIMTDMPTDEIYNLVKFQLATNTTWTFDTYTVIGSGASEVTYSIPGAQCYVMKLDEEMVEEARNLIEEVLNE